MEQHNSSINEIDDEKTSLLTNNKSTKRNNNNNQGISSILKLFVIVIYNLSLSFCEMTRFTNRP